MIGLLFHIVQFIECRQLTVSIVIILTCSALFCLVHIPCFVTIKAPHISHETVLHAAPPVILFSLWTANPQPPARLLQYKRSVSRSSNR